MKANIKQEFYAVCPPGSIRDFSELSICSNRDEALKVQDEEEEMSGFKMTILPIQVFIPVEFIGGSIVISND